MGCAGAARRAVQQACLSTSLYSYITPDVSTSALPSIHIYTTYPIACVNSLDGSFLPLGSDEPNSPVQIRLETMRRDVTNSRIG